ncbi:unnamed protein product [Protopolystoma xenopodis]|uniref:Uncharacterized protein n=1 Tax=Protopolystoma xenopodis TaxID=117903 RepID=A0A448WB18_9PLAT|nr:unnamed protein product [Protopolystoma xenopodis]
MQRNWPNLSPAFHDFVYDLGWPVDCVSHPGWSGGLKRLLGMSDYTLTHPGVVSAVSTASLSNLNANSAADSTTWASAALEVPLSTSVGIPENAVSSLETECSFKSPVTTIKSTRHGKVRLSPMTSQDSPSSSTTRIGIEQRPGYQMAPDGLNCLVYWADAISELACMCPDQIPTTAIGLTAHSLASFQVPTQSHVTLMAPSLTSVQPPASGVSSPPVTETSNVGATSSGWLGTRLRSATEMPGE